MGILSGTNVHYLLKEDANTVISIISGVGKRLPASVTALGKALLSGKTDEEIRAMYQSYTFVPYTEHSILHIDALLAAVQDVRSTGVAYEIEESTADICCVAVPLTENGCVKAAISVTVPKFRYSKEKEQQIAALLLSKKRLIEEICRIQNCRLSF